MEHSVEERSEDGDAGRILQSAASGAHRDAAASCEKVSCSGVDGNFMLIEDPPLIEILFKLRSSHLRYNTFSLLPSLTQAHNLDQA